MLTSFLLPPKNWLVYSLFNRFYIAGSCRFVGLFEHEELVSEEMVGNFAPQCLQVYCDFSDPSYNSCLLVGLLGHEELVSEDTLEYLAPQCLQ